tara:strand:- start:5830 stop:6411 length:582 start_codon:yes stop_codon:yes gene_type:complete
MNRRHTTQITLLFIGIFLIMGTYFFYPKMTSKKIEQSKKIEITETDDDSSNLFENVKYQGLYDVNKPFTVEAKKAHILKDEPDVVYMDNMKVVLEMSDGAVWVITSKKGSYNKQTYDCYFKENVRATDGNTNIYSDNVDLIASEDFAAVYNNVSLGNKEGSTLKADKIDYDFAKKLYKVSMYNNEKVKIKLIE